MASRARFGRNLQPLSWWGAARAVLADPQRKPLRKIAKELFKQTICKRELPLKYFTSGVYHRGNNPTFHLSSKETIKIHKMNRVLDNSSFKNKLLFHAQFSETGLVLPRLLAHSEGCTIFIGNDSRYAGDRRAFSHVIKELCSFSTTAQIFIKPIVGTWGRKCYRLTADDEAGAYCEEITAGRFLFEEALVQHPALAAIHPASVNTVRVITCAGAVGMSPVVIATILRAGARGSAVDNAKQGGLFIGLDVRTGRVLPPARQHMKFGGRTFEAHPDTGFRFAGFELPYFEQVRQAAVAAAIHLPGALAGWDFAIGLDGPVLIEGNSRPGLSMVELTSGGLLANSHFRAFCATLGIRRKILAELEPQS